MVHDPEGVTLDQPNTGQPDEEDISTQAPADTTDTILPAPVVESLPNTGLLDTVIWIHELVGRGVI